MFEFGNANDDQKQAILHTEGPVLIIAGPGTGKTFTLVKRITYLVVEKNVKPEEIMVVTFTEKAARELITRVSNEFIKYGVNINIHEMYIGTFHSVCLRLLKDNLTDKRGEKKSRMMDAFEQTYLVCRNIENFKHLKGYDINIGTNYDYWRQALDICKYVNRVMEELAPVDKMEADVDEDVRFIAKLVIRYRELLDRNNAMDFSSIQTETYRMFENHPDVLNSLREKIRYIMVDEYQDTNYIQEQLVFMIAGERKNICVVGDDDQGMYRFRGATIRNILEFPQKFDEGKCKLIHLNKNYRSMPDIIDFYNKWMRNVDGINLFNWDKYRYDKDIIADGERTGDDKSVFVCGGDSIKDEGRELLHLIERLKSNGNISDYNQVAFLFRSVKSAEAMQIGRLFEENGIPVYSPRSELFFEREEVMQIIGCLIICFGSYLRDLKANRFRYSISRDLREYYIDCVKKAMVLMNSDGNLHDFLEEQMGFVDDLNGGSDIGLLDIIYRLFAYNPFNSYLKVNLNENITVTRAVRNLSEFSRMISRYCSLHEMHKLNKNNKVAMAEEFFNIYLKYMYIDGIGEYEDESEYAPKGCVSFMTIHQSKGLEFPAVVVGSLGASPRKNSDPLMLTIEGRFFPRPPFEPLADIKYFDFWRLYYVAFSRAQNLLVLAKGKGTNKYFDDYLMHLPEVDGMDTMECFEKVKAVKYKKMYSFTSHISIYDGCPSQYKFYKEYGFAQNQMFHTSVGSLVHATLEDMNRCVIDGHINQVSEDTIRDWFMLNYQSMQKQTGYYLTKTQQENALCQVLRYYRHRKDELGKVWKAEEEINLVLPKYILQGIIDLIEGKDETVEVVDYKTGPKPDVERHPETVEHYKKQLQVYAYLIEKRYSKKVSRMHLYYTSAMTGNPLISFEWNRESVENTIDEISETVRRIEDKDFEGKVQNSYACIYCDMKYICGVAKTRES